MRRLLLSLVLLIGSAVVAQAATCTLNATCVADATHAPCECNSAGSWTDCGHVPTQATSDVWSVPAGKQCFWKTDPNTLGGTGTISGTMEFDETTSGRDASGFRNLTVTGVAGADITIASGGKLVMRRGDRLKCDSTTDVCEIVVNDGGLLDVEGDTFDTTIAAGGVATSTPGGACGAGPQYVLTLTDPLVLPASATAATQLIGRRLLFKSGQMVDRQFEITTAALQAAPLPTTPPRVVSVTICPDATDTANGILQRLTPHATLAARTKPAAHHLQPSIGANAACTGADAPATFGCCTGAGAGYCSLVAPLAGDAITIIRDAHIVESAGGKGIWIHTATGGTTTPPVFSAVNFALRDADTNTDAVVRISAKQNGVATKPYTYINLHDSNASNGFKVEGFQNVVWMWGVCHDEQANAGTTQGCFYLDGLQAGTNGCSAGCPYDSSIFSHNEGFRCKQNCLAYGSSDATASLGAAGDYNLVYQGCAAGSAECHGFEMAQAGSAAGRVSHATGNVTYDLYVNGINSEGAHSGGSALGAAVVNDSFTVNVTGPGVGLGPNDVGTRNYVSHTKVSSAAGTQSSIAGKHYSGIYKNANLGNVTPGAMIFDPVAVYGTYFMPLDDVLVGGTDCPGTDNQCTNSTLQFINVASPPPLVFILDNILGPLALTGASGDACGSIGLTCSGSGSPVNFGLTIGHNVYDDRNRMVVESNGRHRFIFEGFGGGSGSGNTFTLYDNAYMGGATGVNSIAPSGPGTWNVTNTWVKNTTTSGVDAWSDPNGALTTNTLYTRVPSLDYFGAAYSNFTLPAGAPMLTSGTNPAGSAVGPRGFLYNRNAINSPWGYGLPFDGEMPTNFSNGSCTVTLNGIPTVEPCGTDTDGDGVLDIHDDCPTDFDPGQFDANSDGVGDACQ
jgi:hypothetical protein